VASFIVDTNVPDYIADSLSQNGHEVTKLRYLQLSQRAKDPVVLEEVKRRQRIFLTRDNDFADPQRFPPEDYWGILILKTDREDFEERCERIQQQLLQFVNQVQNLRGRTYRITRSNVKRLGVQSL
jgi:predicted nuclease of predicted toxin-antitoxin system